MRGHSMPVCTLLTDFGLRDWYVAAMKGTLLRLAPGTVLVDISHEVQPGDVVAAGTLLVGALPPFPAGTVHVAVVDPGVGSTRRMLAARIGDQTCIAPDNGLLGPLLDGAIVHAIDRTDLYLDSPGQTFHGRDRFAPIAAALLNGASLESLGPRIDDALRGAQPPPARRDGAGGRIEGHVIHVDRYGNLVTNVPGSWLRGDLHRARVGALDVRRVATHYAELEPGVPALLVGSLGTLEIALRDASAAATTGIGRGDAVTIELRV